jgi:hypothetical protein
MGVDEDNNKMGLNEMSVRMWTGSIKFETGISGGVLWRR